MISVAASRAHGGFQAFYYTSTVNFKSAKFSYACVLFRYVLIASTVYCLLKEGNEKQKSFDSKHKDLLILKILYFTLTHGGYCRVQHNTDLSKY